MNISTSTYLGVGTLMEGSEFRATCRPGWTRDCCPGEVCIRRPSGAAREVVHRYCPEIDSPEFRARARAVGIRNTAQYDDAWPYGPNIDGRSRIEMVAWAEAEGVVLYNGSAAAMGCLHWLVKGRCATAGCKESWAGYSWLDHTTRWVRHGKPHLLTSQPYGVSDEALAEIDAVCVRYGFEATVSATGWYGRSTTFVRLSRRAEMIPGGAR